MFVDSDLRPHPDQWEFLASIQSMAPQDIEPTILRATGGTQPLDVTFVDDQDLQTPWRRATRPPSQPLASVGAVSFDAIQVALGAEPAPQFVLYGRMSRKQRAMLIAELDALPPDAPRILLATGKLVGEGFDHPPLDTLVLAMPVSRKGTVQQYAGRLHREHAAKTDVRIMDFVDTGHPALLRMWDKRQRGCRTMGYRIAEAPTVMQVMPQSVHPNGP